MSSGAEGEPTIGTLLGSLASDTGTLVRQEIHLASTEMGQKAKNATLQVSVVLMGGALFHAGLLVLAAALILGASTVIPMWISALVLGVIAAGSGWALVQKGLSALRALDPVPTRTIETLQQDKTWAKEQVR